MRLLAASLLPGALALLLALPSRALDTVGSYIAPTHLPAFAGDVSRFLWTSEILEYEGPPADSEFRLRIDFHFVNLEGDQGVCPGLTTALQNVYHTFEDDEVVIPPFTPGLNLYWSALLPDELDGVQLDADPVVWPLFGRVFENVDGLGSIGNNIYNRMTLGAPSPSAPILAHWSVRRVGYETDPSGNFTKDFQGNWIPLRGTYVLWKVEAEINGTPYEVATYYLPAEYCERGSPSAPFVLTQEHFEINGGQLDTRRTKVRYSDFRVFDGSWWHSLNDWKIAFRIDDERGNNDNRFGWIEDDDALLSVCGDASYVSEAARDPIHHFFLDLEYEVYPDDRPGSGGTSDPYALTFDGVTDIINGSEVFTGPAYIDSPFFFPYAQQETGRGFIALHPASQIVGSSTASAAVAKYTADQSALHRFVGDFARANNFQFAGDGVEVMVFTGVSSGAPLFAASISSAHVVDAEDPFSGEGIAHFDFELPLMTGEEVRFAVFAGPPGQQDSTFDVTALRATIAVPEADSVVMLLSGGVALVVVGRKRIRP